MPGTLRRALRTRPHLHDGVRHASHLRGLNLDRVLGIAMERAVPFTRPDLMRATGLSAPTVGSLTTHLLRVGLLRDVGASPSRGGRRASAMEFNAQYGYVAAVHLGAERTRLAVADLLGRVRQEVVTDTPVGRDPEGLLGEIADHVRGLLQHAGVPRGRLLAVGAGAPGAVDPARGVVVALVPNLKGWTNVPMAAVLRKALGAPVVVDNDVNFAVLGEHWRGAARDHATCAFISVGTGIGAGILVNGELVHGHHFLAGEIALMCMGPQYVDTDFGARGCLETLAGLRALRARWPSQGDDPHWIRTLFDAARHGERRAARAVEEVATLIGMAAANLSVVIDPSLIVLGGELVEQAPSIVDEVRRIVARIVPTPSRIVESTLGQDATLQGGLLGAMTEARARVRGRLLGRTDHGSARGNGGHVTA